MDREVLAARTRRTGERALEVGRSQYAAHHDCRRRQRCAVAQTARRLRPLARRALITARPPRVFMRTRKPCVRARRTLEA